MLQTSAPALSSSVSCAAQSFPIPADELIVKAKKLEAAFGGALDDSLLAPDFRFEFPVVSLAREVRGLRFLQGSHRI